MSAFPNPASPRSADESLRELTVAGGCFWCLDAWYRTVPGVRSVVSGYTGGHTSRPDYYSVCAGATGHAEAVRLLFDPSVIDEATLLDMFFAMHDPTTLNRQGYDVGTQYRSALFPVDAAQEATMREAIERNQPLWDAPIVTTIEPSAPFTDAEEEHQDFYAKHPEAGYCQVIINPKLAKARQRFAAWRPVT